MNTTSSGNNSTHHRAATDFHRMTSPPQTAAPHEAGPSQCPAATEGKYLLSTWMVNVPFRGLRLEASATPCERSICYVAHHIAIARIHGHDRIRDPVRRNAVSSPMGLRRPSTRPVRRKPRACRSSRVVSGLRLVAPTSPRDFSSNVAHCLWPHCMRAWMVVNHARQPLRHRLRTPRPGPP